MKHSKDKVGLIAGKTYNLSDGEDEILYEGDWRVVYFDQDGYYYFIYKGKTIYFSAVQKETV